MAKESVPSAHPCVQHGHNNNYFNAPIGIYINEDGESKPRYSVRGCTVCGQRTAYDHETKKMVPIATMFRNISSVIIPPYLQNDYIDWLKFRENSTHST